MAEMRINWGSGQPADAGYREGNWGYPGEPLGTIKVLPTDASETGWFCEMFMTDYNWTFKVPTPSTAVPDARNSIEAWLAGGGQAAIEKKFTTPKPVVMQTEELPNPIEAPDVRATRRGKAR